jgi:hypothetical protein
VISRVIVALLLVIPAATVAGPIGSPLEVCGYHNYGLSVSYEESRIRIEDTDDSGQIHNIRTSRVLAKVNFGLFDFLDVFALGGSANLDFVFPNPDIPRAESKHKFAFGGGFTLRPVYALEGRLGLYITGQMLSYRTTARQEWSTLTQETVYRWYEGQGGVALALSVKNLRPYVGGSWTAFTGKYDYRELDVNGVANPLSVVRGETFTYTNQPPKPVFGVEYLSPGGYRLGFEWRGIYKDEVEWNVWVSQLMIR